MKTLIDKLITNYRYTKHIYDAAIDLQFGENKSRLGLDRMPIDYNPSTRLAFKNYRSARDAVISARIKESIKPIAQ